MASDGGGYGGARALKSVNIDVRATAGGGLSILAYPVVARIVLGLDRWRLAR